MLLAIYAATLAPGITFWDASELIAAIQVLGIPHPPGTPLFVLLGRAWIQVLWPLPHAIASNLLSAVCTAAAGGTLALLLARATGARLAAFGAALCAGMVSTVWLNATETEVYAASLLLAALMLAAAWRAGESGEDRWVVLTAYTFGLAVPLHLSALVAAPAAIVLAAQRSGAAAPPGHAIRWRTAALLTGALVGAAGAGLASLPLGGAGVLLLTLAAIPPRWSWPPRVATRPAAPTGSTGAGTARARRALLVAAVVLVALSALAYLPIRAAHDPALNEGNPATWSALWHVVGRRQYGEHALWPRQAPLWAQVANLFEYADWQFALGLAPGVAPSWLRTPVTLVYAALAVVGSLAHRARDRRSWRGLLVLLLCASAGLVVYLNFKAGASFGYGVLPGGTLHEVRERDYFFALAFWMWGGWAGFGAVTLAARAPWRIAPFGVALAALPVVLNWRAADRRSGADTGLARTAAQAYLWSAPRDAVLVTGGDNDSFPIWYMQMAEGVRRDVTVVVAPLLGTAWYRDELARRDSLLDPAAASAPLRSEREGLARVARGARRLGRPLAVTLLAGAGTRAAIGGAWRLRGVVFVQPEMKGGKAARTGTEVTVDTAAAAAFARRFGRSVDDALRGEARRAARGGTIDPEPGITARALACPMAVLAAVRAGAPADSLDSRCKFR